MSGGHGGPPSRARFRGCADAHLRAIGGFAPKRRARRGARSRPRGGWVTSDRIFVSSASPSRSSASARARSPRRVVHRGVVEAAAVLLDEGILGAGEVRRRIVRAWGPGAMVYRLGSALLLRFPAPRWIDCARAPGLPLVRLGAALVSAPLGPDELAALAAPTEAVVVVRGGALGWVVPVDADREDPAAYLEVAGFAPIAVAALGPEPEPLLVVQPAVAATRSLFGIDRAPEQMAEVAAALRAKGAGTAPVGGDRALPPFLVKLLATVATLLANLGGSAGRGGAGAGASSALVRVPQQGAPPAGPSRFAVALRNLFARIAVSLNLAPFLGRRQAEYLGKMLDLFDRGDLGEALRHAIPLAGEGQGTETPALGVPTRRQELAISGGAAGAGSTLYTPEDFFADLRRRYRAAFERLEREERIEEAAFVLAELLGESAEAVAFLERHGRYLLAAEIAEARQLPPGLLVRQWLLAGDAARAVRIARRHGAFADALARLEKHPQGPVLRLLWAETLATAGDFAAAVEVVWPVEEARHLAAAWIEGALGQGGAVAARMLAKKLALVPGSFPAVRERVLALLDDEGEGTWSQRRVFAEALLDGPASPEASTLARPLLRALIRDGGRSGEPAIKTLVGRLATFAGDDVDVLRADLPAWVSIERILLAHTGSPRHIEIEAADTGASAVHDAVRLPGGRLLVALGEAGVRVFSRRGEALFQLDQPAHRLVVSDRGDRALALAERGEAWRVARIDLLARRTEVWCEASVDAFAKDFDGAQWVVAAGGKLLVIDALERRFEALQSFDIGAGVVVTAIARSASGCTVAFARAEHNILRYELPAWTLRARTRLDLKEPEGRGRSLETTAGTGVEGVVAVLTRSAEDCRLFVARDNRPAREEVLPIAAATSILSAQTSRGWVACAIGTGAGVEVRVLDMVEMDTRLRVTLAEAGEASLRLDDQSLTVADDRGRVLVVDLAHGDVIADLRT